MPAGSYYWSYCCVSWCQNNGKTNKKPGTKFFRFPRDSRSKAWLDYAKRNDLAGKPASQLYASYRVSSDHFAAKDFMDPGHTRLTRSAVPTVRPPTNWIYCGSPSPCSSPSLLCLICILFQTQPRQPSLAHRLSTSACRKPMRRPEDVIKRLQVKISSYKKTIARLRKQEQKTPKTASEALETIRPHVSEE
ncbi:unnamed protein product, partial [Ixodes hexagonus]